MGTRQDKRMRKIAAKAGKDMALELAKNQILDLIQQPFKIRWAFCKTILFPKKKKVPARELEMIKLKSYGGFIPDIINKGEK
jgi:hypothetical protein